MLDSVETISQMTINLNNVKLKIVNLFLSFGQLRALDRIDIEVRGYEILAVIVIRHCFFGE